MTVCYLPKLAPFFKLISFFYEKSTGQYRVDAFFSSSNPTLLNALAINQEQKYPRSSLTVCQSKSLYSLKNLKAFMSYFLPRFFLMKWSRVCCAYAFRIQLNFLRVILRQRSKYVTYCFQSQMETPCIWLHQNTMRSFFLSFTTIATWSKSLFVKNLCSLAPVFSVQNSKMSPVSAVLRNYLYVSVS